MFLERGGENVGFPVLRECLRHELLLGLRGEAADGRVAVEVGWEGIPLGGFCDQVWNRDLAGTSRKPRGQYREKARETAVTSTVSMAGPSASANSLSVPVFRGIVSSSRRRRSQPMRSDIVPGGVFPD